MFLVSCPLTIYRIINVLIILNLCFFIFFYYFYLCVAIGNEKSNRYWEAELPPNFDRSGIEKFIRAK
jgi:hypothetical protein